MTRNTNVDRAWWALRLTFGLGAFFAGLANFFNVFANWDSYLAPAAGNLLPVGSTPQMRNVGVIEMFVGIPILAGMTRIPRLTEARHPAVARLATGRIGCSAGVEA
jgi:hypothetical protein